MPIYEYERIEGTGCDECPAPSFEVVQRMADEPLTTCPSCGAKVVRRVTSAAVHGAGASHAMLSNKNLSDKGFTQYKKAGDGFYEKTAGKGPDVIRR